MVPAKTEVCDGKDDDCDGKTDVGCTAAAFAFKVSSVAMDGGSGTGVMVREVAVAGPAGGDKSVAQLGWIAWLRKALK